MWRHPGSRDGDRSPVVQSPEVEAATVCPVTGSRGGHHVQGNVQIHHVMCRVSMLTHFNGMCRVSMLTLYVRPALGG